MEKLENLIFGKTATSSDTYPVALVTSNITGFGVRGNELSVDVDNKPVKFFIDPTRISEIVDMLSSVVKENYPKSDIDDSMVVTLVSTGGDKNLIIGKTPVKTTSFCLSEVIQISSAYSKVVVTTTTKTIIVNVPPTTDAKETIIRLFNPDEKRLTRVCGINHTLYRVTGKFDEEWEW